MSSVTQCGHHPALIGLTQTHLCLYFMGHTHWADGQAGYQEDRTQISHAKWQADQQVVSQGLCGLGKKQNQKDSDIGEPMKE